MHGLPPVAWDELVRWLRPGGDAKRRRAMLTLRACSRSLRDAVARSPAAVGTIWLDDAGAAEALVEADTAGLGGALCVAGWLATGNTVAHARIASALAVALDRGHAIMVRCQIQCSAAIRRSLEDVIVWASRSKRLVGAVLDAQADWRGEALRDLAVLELHSADPAAVAAIADAGRVRAIRVCAPSYGFCDLEPLARLERVAVVDCYDIRDPDLKALSAVPEVEIVRCGRVKALPAMRNASLAIRHCDALADISQLAGGHVETLVLESLGALGDIEPIGRMEPPARVVWLRDLPRVTRGQLEKLRRVGRVAVAKQ